MTDFTLKQQSFVQNDIPTRLGHLAANLSQIQTFWLEGSHQDTLIQLVKESRYLIESIVTDMVKADDIDRAAELVDLVRVLTRWLFKWDTIWSDTTEKLSAAQQTEDWLRRVLEISGSV
ncbi:MAG: hypothetical protein KME60_18675 [Cyanomargarita calcarea GSE-NOS-MK-12-04C]|jgi:hypothetical protein|uniref:Uncharacterized protein n=1 Tax=Cyanomargarita calcarea GSE-NOS-MK-12-04C TaxID=2839659 RepID=A0A951QQP2_9CYAN|nr:hypothetical protein [Cyanomargarita calcarea GSE-NOS-MK-12-04C]